MTIEDIKDIEDIEDIGNITLDQSKEFVKEFVKEELNDKKEYQKKYNDLKRKYKLNLNKPTLRKIYNQLIDANQIQPNQSFLNYSIRRKSRSISGVTVITILTDPYPEYYNSNGEKVKQEFSCGHNCAYCPNEPEIKINLKILEIHKDKNSISIESRDDIHLIRVITYFIHKWVRFDIEHCYDFKENGFTMKLKDNVEDQFKVGDEFIGVKIAQPRSYLSTEPAVLRANRNNFDPILQIQDRFTALENCGHEVDKIEIIVLGGTWDHYPYNYRENFIKDIYYAVNSIKDRTMAKTNLEAEIKYNEINAKSRIIGLTIETRPDCVTLKQIKQLRKFNVTRLQIGVQHLDEDILHKIERGCRTEDTIRGTHLWKQNGGKIDWHLMPDLPGSSVKKDIEMFKKMFQVNSIIQKNKNHFIYDLQYPEFQADQLKIYPCEVTDWTKIKEWYDNGTYKPYSENIDDLIQVIVELKNNIFPWIRLNRIVRDIPNLNIIGGNSTTNLRQLILQRKDVNCKCIRCREVKDNTSEIHNAELFIREYNGIRSTEYFLSFESPDQEILYGFLRLRINHTNESLIVKELEDCAFIRELHVYGKVVRHDDKCSPEVQHFGFGSQLIKKAEEIVLEHNIKKIAIISGVGVRQYYRDKHDYELVKNYMIKTIESNYNLPVEVILCSLLFLLSISILYDLVNDNSSAFWDSYF